MSDNPADRDQAQALREQARAGGLRFEAYLPGSLADWLLEHLEKGHFVDPSEAVFVMMGLFRDMEPHQDLREELLRRKLQAAMFPRGSVRQQRAVLTDEPRHRHRRDFDISPQPVGDGI